MSRPTQTPKPSRSPDRSADRRAGSFAVAGQRVAADPIAPGLYLVATPIGNLADISLRALRVLAAADAVLAEDTRVTRVLLSHYGIETPLHAYHDHSGETVRTRILERLQASEALALVSDAGTPLVSDPGYRLVAAALEAGIGIVPIPGASAALAALVAAGLPTDRFFFEGFLPAKAGARRGRLEALAGIPGTLVVYEAPHRIAETLADAADLFGPRQAAVCRELTKLHETVRRGSLVALAAAFAAEPPPRGEIVLAIAAAGEEAVQRDREAGLDEKLQAALARHTVKDAAALVAGETGLSRREVYARALALARAPLPGP